MRRRRGDRKGWKNTIDCINNYGITSTSTPLAASFW